MSFHTDEALLRYEHVDVSFKGCAVLHDISISLGRGEILAVVGESGCGKSTLLRAAVKLLGASGLITRGHIWFEGKDLPALSERALRPIRGASVGMIFQDASASLAPVRTVGEQVFEAVAAHERTTEREVRKRAFDLFRTLHFETPERLWESYPFELSGGMCQRVGIVMAMLLRPQVLLADEPTSALDASVEVEVMRELLALREQFGMAIMLVTHDMGVAARMADRLLVLKDGYRRGGGCPPSSAGRLHQSTHCSNTSTTEERRMIPILSVRGLTKVFGIPKREPITAVSNVTFDLAAGTALGVVGDSGCGKSTLVRLIMRLMPSTAGTILLKGHDITHLNERALREVYRTMQMVFQQPAASFDPRRTLGDGIGEPLRNQGRTRHQADRCAAELLERCGLTADMAARYPHEVSGGQCQRAAIARALAVSPELLICDEATSALDVTVAGQIMTLLKDLRRESGLSVLFISHSLELVQSFCDEMLVMNRGSIVESGTAGYAAAAAMSADFEGLPTRGGTSVDQELPR